MLFAEDTISNWSVVISTVVTTVFGGLFLWLRERDKDRNNTEVALLKNDVTELKKEHHQCQIDVATLKADLKTKDDRIEFERRRAHNLGNFIIPIFAELGASGIGTERIESLREQYLALFKSYQSPEGGTPDGHATP